jgi:hypothetical protein
VLNPVKIPYVSPELRVYGTLRELTLVANGTTQDHAASCPSGVGCHVSTAAA